MKVNLAKIPRGFSLVEILTVIAIIGILATVASAALRIAQEKAYYNRAKLEFKHIATALDLYYQDHDETYPDDANRDLPNGLSEYLAGYESGTWPDGPWPGSVYDWDNWEDPDHPGDRIYQISIRFCPAGGPIEACVFPPEDWAEDFGINSALYYCVSGFCRAHVGEAYNYPGYCTNCEIQPSGN